MNEPQGNNAPVYNPALGSAAAPLNISPVSAPPAGGFPPPSQEAYNPYAPQPAPTPAPQPNPYGQPGPSNPYVAPPQQLIPQQQPQGGNPFTPPAFNFTPQYQPAPQQSNPAQFPFQPSAPQAPQGLPNPQGTQQLPQPLLPQQQPQQPQQQQQQNPQQSQTFSDEDIQQLFPDDTSRAIFTGISALAGMHNVDLLQAFETAYVTRDPQHINERYLAQFDPNVVAQLKGQFQALVGVQQQREQQTIQSVYQLAGGEPQWKAAQSVFQQACPPEQRAVIAELLNSGDQAKVQFAAQQVLAFAAQSGRTIVRDPRMMQQQGAGNGSGQLLTKEQFYQQLDLLSKAHQPGTPEYDRNYRALVEQRQLAKSYGY